MEKVLVTGGAGFIGSHLAGQLKDAGYRVVVIDNLSSGSSQNILPQIEFIHGDVRNEDLLTWVIKDVDYIFHLAALVSVQESFIDFKKCFDININGLLNILNAAVRYRVKKIVYSSSSAIYSEEPYLPKTENICPKPASPYALSKLDGEYLLDFYHKQYDLGYVALRYFNVFGSRQNYHSMYSAVVPIFITKALLNEDLIIYGDGLQTRDFIYVEDVVGANLLAMKTQVTDFFNVGTGVSITILDLARLVIELTASKSKIVFTDKKPGDLRYSQADISKIKEKLNWQPAYDFREALNRVIDWYRNIIR